MCEEDEYRYVPQIHGGSLGDVRVTIDNLWRRVSNQNLKRFEEENARPATGEEASRIRSSSWHAILELVRERAKADEH